MSWDWWEFEKRNFIVRSFKFYCSFAYRSGLINTKTGNPIPDKLVERLVNRQRIAMQQVAAMRLKYIVLKDMVANKHNAIAEIDNVGEGLRLRDYEQLKVENR